jgi:hypothetical protein
MDLLDSFLAAKGRYLKKLFQYYCIGLFLAVISVNYFFEIAAFIAISTICAVAITLFIWLLEPYDASP